MTSAVLVVRPEPGASRTAKRLVAEGFAPILYPLFRVEPVDWTPPDPGALDALLFTSANAARLGGAGLARFAPLPAYAVGAATARAVAAAGFRDVRTGGGDVAATVPMIAAAGHRHVLHLCGAVVRPYAAGALRVERVAVYRTAPLGDAAGLAAALPPGALSALVHSPRAGERLAALVPPGDRARIALVAISDATARACGAGWRAVAVSERPGEDAMIGRLAGIVS